MALLLTCANDSLHVCTAHKALMLYCTLLPGNPKSTIHRPLCASDQVNVNSQTRHNWRFALCIKIFALCTLRRAQGEVESSVQNALLVKCLLCQPSRPPAKRAPPLTWHRINAKLFCCFVWFCEKLRSRFLSWINKVKGCVQKQQVFFRNTL